MPSISLKLTNRALRKIKTPREKKLITHSDEVVQGLRARKSSSGRVTLYVEQKFKNQSLKITIGVFPDLSVREARKKQ